MVIDRCRPWIEAALEYANGTATIEDIEERIADGRLQLWPAEKGCVLTEFVEFPQKTVLNIAFAGGEMGQLKDMMDSIAAFAKINGASAVTITGRPGWARVWPDFKPWHVVIGKDI